MLKVNHTLVLTVSALALSAGNVSAAFPNPPLASVLCTKLHTSYNSQSMQSSAPARQVAHPQGVASLLLVDGNFQNQSSTVMFGLDPNIQVKQGFLSHLDSRVTPLGWREDDSSFLAAGTMRTPVRIYAEVIKPLADGVKLPQFASVCFITDTGECQGVRAGGGSEDKPVNPDVIDPDSVARCKKEGYNLTSCNSVQEPFNRCPYNNSYFEKCVCRSDLKTCTKPQYGVGESCGGKYASCQTDNPRACKEDGYTNTCPSGQKLKKSPRCPYDSSFGICCSPSCPQYTSTTSSSYGTNGTDGCGYACYYTCQINCPSGTTETNPGGCGGSTSNGCGNKTCYYPYKACCDDTNCPSNSSKSYNGSYAGKTGCGNSCYYKRSCPGNASTSYHGSSAGYDDNGNFCGYYCSSSCSAGSANPYCSSTQRKVYAGSSECGSCYKCEANPDCNVTSKSCSYGCASTNSCGKCTECKNPDCSLGVSSCALGKICIETNSCNRCTNCASCKLGYSVPACKDNNSFRILDKDALGCCGWNCPDNWYDCRGGTCNGKCSDSAYNEQKIEGCLPLSICK